MLKYNHKYNLTVDNHMVDFDKSSHVLAITCYSLPAKAKATIGCTEYNGS